MTFIYLIAVTITSIYPVGPNTIPLLNLVIGACAAFATTLSAIAAWAAANNAKKSSENSLRALQDQYIPLVTAYAIQPEGPLGWTLACHNHGKGIALKVRAYILAHRVFYDHTILPRTDEAYRFNEAATTEHWPELNGVEFLTIHYEDIYNRKYSTVHKIRYNNHPFGLEIDRDSWAYFKHETGKEDLCPCGSLDNFSNCHGKELIENSKRMHELEKKSNELREQAKSILKGSKLLDLLSQHGEVKIGGSYALDLMNRPDIDIFVVTGKHDWNKIVELHRQIMETKYFREFDFLNWIDFEPDDPDAMRGYYFQTWIPKFGQLWKMDIWFITPEFDKTNEKVEVIKEKLATAGDEAKIAILQIKDTMREGKKYKKGVSGELIYTAVLDHGVRDVKAFEKFTGNL